MKTTLLLFTSLLAGFGLCYIIYPKTPSLNIAIDDIEETTFDERRKELKEAWEASKRFSFKILEQMPEEGFSYKYTPEAMTFAEQWRHCCIYTCNMLAGRFNLDNSPYPDKSQYPPVVLNKIEVKAELTKMYDYVFNLIETLPAEKLLETVSLGGEEMPGWRFIYAMENHIIHHRGSCVVYLRLNDIVPIGYFGW